jgi:hypothetical protein
MCISVILHSIVIKYCVQNCSINILLCVYCLLCTAAVILPYKLVFRVCVRHSGKNFIVNFSPNLHPPLGELGGRLGAAQTSSIRSPRSGAAALVLYKFG